MGKHDSSRTRVEPVFDALYDSDPSGRLWLPSLLQLGSRVGDTTRALDAGRLIDNHPRWWGKNERRLDPPKALLQWLVRTAFAPVSDALWGGQAARGKREKLVARDEATIAEGLRFLEGPLKYRVWYVLEGQSRPDACIETERIILVVEGKRTEREATVATTWMPQRSQMLRHMDAAWEIRGEKQVLGLLIVEGDGGADVLVPSQHWFKEAEDQVSERSLRDSLPHRSPGERESLSAGFLGVTTWQKVCWTFGLKWPPHIGG